MSGFGDYVGFGAECDYPGTKCPYGKDEFNAQECLDCGCIYYYDLEFG